MKIVLTFFILLYFISCKSASRPTRENLPQESKSKTTTTPVFRGLEDGLYAVLYGKGKYPNYLTDSGKKEGEQELAFLFYLIKQNKRIILVDSGISSEETRSKYGIRDWVSPDKILLKAGIRPTAVTDIILTHFHFDHAGGLDVFRNARIYVRPQEWELLKKANWFADQTKILHARENEKKVIFLQSSIELFPNFRIIFTGGHTPGHSAVEWLRAPKNRVLITGDECYFIDHCIEGTGLPASAASSVRNNREFLQYVELLAEQGTKIFTSHDSIILEQNPEILPRIFKIY
ncbi:metallo-beta-lactamase domain protein [Leptospira inadai serovar Lyme str. 10]|uniref:Metallo-beta-lactamase domain protein n=2 Tax=Leptospira inadai serovar Lyme TaxID=293084 RepID=V6HA71_9LEPT|nr:N-acyl homoserine lactonase family protein [Leptospira inadai]EQA35218.1 metallo-beta-lactamase domain protein [Leptospira inadai serovar Lyme str. 10]PNV73112.1 Zn-dependent hydrolase [Leptospira inadai serovar Lyme]